MRDKDFINGFKDELFHYGKGHLDGGHSGRYPWGSGDDPYQHTNEEFYNAYRDLGKRGLTQVEIAQYFGISTDELRQRVTLSVGEKRQREREKAVQLRDHGYSEGTAAQMMGISKSTYRNRLREAEGTRTTSNKSEKREVIIDRLKNEVANKQYIDIGAGVELALGTSAEGLKAATRALQDEGYEVITGIKVPQATNPGKFTWMKILAPEGTTKSEVYKNMEKISSVEDYTKNGLLGDNPDVGTKVGIVYPKSIDLSRVYIRYPDEGGAQKDGIIELRKGVKDISLNGAKYAQVRIATDNKYYLKGVAVYGRDKDIPEGYDVVFNTSKDRGKPLDKVLKPLKEDPDNPFGATIKKNGQHYYTDDDGNKQLSVINKVNEEGDWEEWSKSLSSQFLSKQPIELIKRQLGLSYAEKEDEFNTIMSLTNPTVKKKLLEGFSDDCDASAVHLKAAALPRQASKLLIPINSLDEKSVYAPGLDDGTRVCLIRYPHAGTFEIPRLVVNNKNREGKDILGNTRDAIGINYKVAEQLSGADFDGDTVLMIPESATVKINATRPLEELKGFDPRKEYPAFEGMTPVKDQKGWDKQIQMGNVSNLITDMTLHGASEDKIARAVKHSMVIIDAEKHNLDYKKSYKDNRIKELQIEFQGRAGGGASTLISLAKHEVDVLERKQVYLDKDIDPETGKINYRTTGRTIKRVQTDSETGEPIINPVTGKKVYYDTGELAKEKAPLMAETNNAFDLSSGTLQETEYALYANKLKALANTARKEYLAIEEKKADSNASKTYRDEIDSLNQKLLIAQKNAPRERQAQVMAYVALKAKTDANPELKDKDHKSELKRTKAQLLTGARAIVGASKTPVSFTPEEWEAVENGAVSPSKLSALLDNADMDVVKKLAMPRQTDEIPDSTKTRIRQMDLSGYTMAEIADALGISSSQVGNILKERS